MERNLYQIVYTSSSSELMESAELEIILASARKNNANNKVTGMLLYSEGVFIQVLEGPEQAVRETYELIARDPRHHGAIVLLESGIENRNFSNWAMGFKQSAKSGLADNEGYSEFLNSGFDPSLMVKNPSASLKLLLSFRKNMT
ncbi:hypothetical protein EOPP23_19245 [Endozoicomonas sp. OPT23]|uniref:BLUF domain-containing protein n=1 Tax=Endozoicomonas sp. OPT23 TaxID=2072845 RepID=UPI00129A3C3A|nr:BLUF domain-containing protein [Endozoicomonas sp. OPT23]MRI35105.1 hypothetical protein [Endozoicomonas sp. OPT23]